MADRKPAKIIDAYAAILLDVNGTFMFGQDRFDDDEIYQHVYRDLGGSALAGGLVNRLIGDIVDYLLPRYRDPAWQDRFPSVGEAIRAVSAPFDVGNDDLERLEQVMAIQELGQVPAAHADCVRALAQSHRLAVVSDIWSRSDRWHQTFAAAGIADAFEVIVFSSDGRHVKPSPALFEMALSGLDCTATEAIHVGDNLQRDVAGAQALGLHTVWLSGGREPAPLLAASPVKPSYILDKLTELPEARA